MSIDRIASTPASNAAVAQSAARPTPTPVRAGAAFGEVLRRTGSAIASGAGAAAINLPGSSIMAAAVRGAPAVIVPMTPMSAGGVATGPLGGGVGGTSAQGPGASGVGTSAGDSLTTMQAQDQQYLQMEMEMQAENRSFTALSNILMVRHETAKAAINNIRA